MIPWILIRSGSVLNCQRASLKFDTTIARMDLRLSSERGLLKKVVTEGEEQRKRFLLWSRFVSIREGERCPKAELKAFRFPGDFDRKPPRESLDFRPRPTDNNVGFVQIKKGGSNMPTLMDLPASKPRHRTYRLVLSIDAQHYLVRPLVCDPILADRAFRLTKSDGTFYDVLQGNYGPTCDCPDFIFRRDGIDPNGCKHIQGLVSQGLVQRVGFSAVR
jgi:hypothetical protein